MLGWTLLAVLTTISVVVAGMAALLGYYIAAVAMLAVMALIWAGWLWIERQ
jgi:hypothetical protein